MSRCIMPDNKLKRKVEKIIGDDVQRLQEFDSLCSTLSTFKLSSRPYPLGRKIILDGVVEERPWPTNVCAFILQTILQSNRQKKWQRKNTSWKSRQYWDQRKKVEEAREKLEGDFRIIRSVEVVYYKLDELETCPHGKPRYECEQLHADRGLAEWRTRPGVRRIISSSVLGEDEKYLQSPGEKLCVPRYRHPEDEQPPKSGRPEDKWINDLMASVIWILHHGCGLTARIALRYTGKILLFVFNEELSPDALRKRWRRLKENSLTSNL